MTQWRHGRIYPRELSVSQWRLVHLFFERIDEIESLYKLDNG